MRGMLSLILRFVIASGISAVFFALAPTSAHACPTGSQFFAWGGAGGCVEPGTNKVVQKCFNMGKACPSGWSNELQTDTGSWCCPPVAKPQRAPSGESIPPGETCVWRGTAPFCKGTCLHGEDSKGTSKTGDGETCVTGIKIFCCRTASTENCVWRGTAPACDGKCLPGEDSKGTSKTGDGETCVTGIKILCCK